MYATKIQLLLRNNIIGSTVPLVIKDTFDISITIAVHGFDPN